MQDGEAQGADTQTQQPSPATVPSEATQSVTQGEAAEAAKEQGSEVEKQAAGTQPADQQDVSGLKAKNEELLGELKSSRDELKTLREEKRQREQDEAQKRGDHETVITQLREENATLKSDAEQWQAHLSAKRAEISKAAKNLPAAARKFVADPDSLTTLTALDQAAEHIAFLAAQSEKPTPAPISNAAPSVTAANGSTVRLVSEMSRAEQIEFERQRMSAAKPTPLMPS